jgi:hypothetical protein
LRVDPNPSLRASDFVNLILQLLEAIWRADVVFNALGLTAARNGHVCRGQVRHSRGGAVRIPYRTVLIVHIEKVDTIRCFEQGRDAGGWNAVRLASVDADEFGANRR